MRERFVQLAFAASLFGLAVSLGAQVAIPTLRSPVLDDAVLLREETRQGLEAPLREAWQQQRHQGVVWIVQSLDGEPIEQATLRATTTWGLGDAKRDDGWLFLISVRDRRARIEVGQGLEGVLTDVACSRVIRQILGPGLRAGDPDRAITLAVRAIEALIQGQALDKIAPPRGRQALSPTAALLVVGLAFGFILLVGVFNGGLLGGSGFGRSSRRRHWGGGSGSGWGGGSGSGGGYSGGGGGFSGGGSSGGW